MFYGKQTTAARVDAVQSGSAAAEAGFQPGDQIVAIDGRPIESFSDMQRIVSSRAGQKLEFVIDRGGVRQHVVGNSRVEGGEGQLRQRASASGCSGSAGRWRPET